MQLSPQSHLQLWLLYSTLAMTGCERGTSLDDEATADKPRDTETSNGKGVVLATIAPSPARSSEEGPGGQRHMINREALIPPQCYTKTDGQHNPCYVCHQDPIEGDGHENRMADGYLQGDYHFSDFALTNHWRNLFEDRTERVSQISDAQILEYVSQDNYSALKERLSKDDRFKGWRPDLENLHLARSAFDELGFAKDGSHWVAFNYMPMPSTFWPTNGSTDDVMVRLPKEFRTRQPGGPFVKEVYLANLVILEAAIKNLETLDSPPIDENAVGSDLDGDGKLARAHRVVRRKTFVGAARGIEVQTFLYPRGTEFLHTVRYVGIDERGETIIPPRMKEVRYMVKHTQIPKFALAGLYDNEVQEKIEGNPPYFADFRDRGVDNGFGWRLQGFIEDAEGELRPNTYEETLFCMGCHSTIGTTIDKVFSFARKQDGPAGFGYIDLHKMRDVPALGEEKGQILTYLERTGGGSEFRNNEEMQERWFKDDGTVASEKVEAAPDVHSLITPSQDRAVLLNKAYRVIVMDQSFLLGRDATVSPPSNVLSQIEREIAPLAPEHRHKWDIRLAW